MEEKIVGPKLVAWAEKLTEAGASLVEDGKVKVNPAIRSQIASIHATLAGAVPSEKFAELEDAFDAAIEEVNTMISDGGPIPLLP